MAKRAWLEEVGQELVYVCNGDTRKYHDMVECKMSNGNVIVSVAGDGTRMLVVKRIIGKKFQKASMESRSDKMVVTRSLSGSIEFLHRMGESPEVRIEQKGKRLGAIKINAYNDKVKTDLYGWFG